jgi:diaminopimelate epimerase
MPTIPFVKGHGLGNDYLVLREADLPVALSASAIRRICDRNFGAGSDGILLLVPSTRAGFGLRIFNPDGSEAEKSGNGLRIFAKFLWDHGLACAERFSVEVGGEIVECVCHPRDGRMNAVTVELGAATFAAEAIPMHGIAGEAVEVPLDIDGEQLRITAVKVGNPHCVTFVDRLDEAVCRRLGPRIEQHAAFPRRTNVQFARVAGEREVEILIWERGAGYTLASGSSSCAVAAAAIRTGRCPPGAIRVAMPGGELSVEVRGDWSLRLEGPVEEVCTGVLTAEFVADYVGG